MRWLVPFVVFLVLACSIGGPPPEKSEGSDDKAEEEKKKDEPPSPTTIVEVAAVGDHGGAFSTAVLARPDAALASTFRTPSGRSP